MTGEPFLYLSPRWTGLAEPLCADIELLDRVLGTVLEEQEGRDLLLLARRLFKDEGEPHTLAERIPELAHPPTVKRLLRAFTTLFQLLNTAEQKEIVRVNRERQARAAAGVHRTESIAEAIERLQKAGTTPDQMQELLDRIFICPTLTAHPTEARRRAVQDKLQTIAQALADRALPADLPWLDRPLNVEGRAEQTLREALTALWQTDELRATPITVEDEARNGAAARLPLAVDANDLLLLGGVQKLEQGRKGPQEPLCRLRVFYLRQALSQRSRVAFFAV